MEIRLKSCTAGIYLQARLRAGREASFRYVPMEFLDPSRLKE